MPISNAQSLARPAALGLGAVSALLATGALFFSTSETMLKAQFVTAFDSYTVAASPARETAERETASTPVAAGEDFWLGSADRDGVLGGDVKPASWSGGIAEGDEITVSGVGGKVTYEVASITELPLEGVTHIAHGAPPQGLLLVTARKKGAGEADQIRFVVERNAGQKQPVTTPKAL